jgi:hypothetical protein
MTNQADAKSSVISHSSREKTRNKKKKEKKKEKKSFFNMKFTCLATRLLGRLLLPSQAHPLSTIYFLRLEFWSTARSTFDFNELRSLFYHVGKQPLNLAR